MLTPLPTYEEAHGSAPDVFCLSDTSEEEGEVLREGLSDPRKVAFTVDGNDTIRPTRTFTSEQQIDMSV